MSISTSKTNALPIWVRIALRELRGGLNGFKVFIACLIVGVATIAAIGSLTKSIESSLSSEGKIILGGDIEISVDRTPLPPQAINWVQKRARMITTTRMPTMVRALKANNKTNTLGESTMVDLRSVTYGYPLYGTVETAPQLPMAEILAEKEGIYGVAVEDLLADRLNLSVGDRLRLNQIEVEIRALVLNEPDKANLGFQIGPTVFLSSTALPKTGLVQFGSQIDYDYKLILPENSKQDIAQFKTDLQAEYPESDWRIRDHTNAAPGLRRFIDRMGMFLTLVGLTALIVGGVGVGNAVKGYMDFKTKTIATLKILGASGSMIFKIYFAQIIMIGAASIAVGLMIGSYAPGVLIDLLPDSIPITAKAGVYMEPLVLAALYGLLTTTAFTAWPLGKARDLPPVRLFREQVDSDRKRPRWTYVALIVACMVAVVALAIGYSDRKVFTGVFLIGAVLSLGILQFASSVIQWLARRLPRMQKPLVRLAVANIHRPGATTGPVTISLGLALTLFTAIALIEGNLDAQVREQVPERAPSFFFLDIQKDQLPALKSEITALDGVNGLESLANLRGTVTKIKGKSFDPEDFDTSVRWVLRGDRPITYMTEKPQGSDIIAGTWWPADYSGAPEISIGEDQARGLGLSVGDTITMNILGAEITASVRSLRKINWGSMGFNFVFIFDPYTLAQAPHTFMASLSTQTPAAEKAAFKVVTDNFANVSVIRMKEILQRVNDLLSQISVAIKWTAVVAILSGVLVLAGAIAAGFRQRVYESVILKVVGAVRRQILWAYVLEYMMVGLIVAFIALGIGGLAGYAVVTQGWEMQFQWLPVPVFTTLIVSLLFTMGFGLSSSLRALSVRPNTILRNE